MKYIIHSRGYTGGPVFATKTEAIVEMNKWIKDDCERVKRKYGQATKKIAGDTVEVYIGNRHSVSLWSSYSIGQTI